MALPFPPYLHSQPIFIGLWVLPPKYPLSRCPPFHFHSHHFTTDLLDYHNSPLLWLFLSLAPSHRFLHIALKVAFLKPEFDHVPTPCKIFHWLFIILGIKYNLLMWFTQPYFLCSLPCISLFLSNWVYINCDPVYTLLALPRTLSLPTPNELGLQFLPYIISLYPR